MTRAPRLSEQLNDIQGMLKSGFGWLANSRFLLLTIRDGRENEARAWLARLFEEDLIVSAKCVAEGRTKRGRPIDRVTAVAFSFSGLVRLGCQETEGHPFPTPFRNGMGSALRETLLRDTSRDQWRWSDVEGFNCRQIVHILVAQWQSGDRASHMAAPAPEAFAVVTTVENRPNSFKDGKLYEPFGFRDDIAQPVIRGLREEDEDSNRARQDAGALYEDRVIAPGEFILGYLNEYGEPTYCPDVAHWPQSDLTTHPGGHFALNGSYLAVRQIQQNVEAFRAFEAAHGQPICEKLMGRRKSGVPLSWQDSQDNTASDSLLDAFRYRVEDANGFVCPKGAHIRRMNPRDTLGVDVQSGIRSSKLHRLLRRGRPYLEVAENEPQREGLFFIACNADIERQFEFIHQRWLRNFRLENLHHEDDPIVGSPAASKTFTIPGLPSGGEVSLGDFAQTIGGGYFFLPGIAALRFIAGQMPDAKPAKSNHALPVV